MTRLMLALAGAVFMAGAVMAQVFTPIASQQVTFTDSASGTSTATGTQTYAVRLVCTTDCLIDFSTPVTLETVTTLMFLPANVPMTFILSPNRQIAVTEASTAGTLYITELSK